MAIGQIDQFDDTFEEDFAAPAEEPVRAEDAQVSPPAEPEEANGSDAEAAPSTAEDEERNAAFRSHNSWRGPTGGVHLVDAGSGLPGSFRLQLGIEGFSSSDFLNDGDDNAYMGGSLSLSWTIIEHLEVFGHIANHANSNTTGDPQLIQVLGDTTLGAKGYYPILPWLIVGGDLRLVLLNPVGDIGLVGAGTSFGLNLAASGDLRKLSDPLPLIVRTNIGYYFDNSGNLIEDVEAREYAELTDPAERQFETRHLIAREERFGLGVSRMDEFFFGIGAEAPLQVDEDFYIHPLLEWSFSHPVNRQGYTCVVESTDASAGQPDGCFDLQTWAAVHSNLTLGARVFPPLRGLGVMLAFDIGLSGVGTHVRELPANRPYNVMLALAYAYDTTAEPAAEPVEVVKEVEVVKPSPPQPRIAGLVVEQGLGDPIAGALVRYPGHELTAQATDAEGRFVSYELAPGDVQVEVSHPDYEARVCLVTLPEPAEGGSAAPATEAAPVPVPLGPVDSTGAPVPPPNTPQYEGSVSGNADVDAEAVGGIGSVTASDGAAPAGPPESARTSASLESGAGSSDSPLQPTAPLLVDLRCELTAKPRMGRVSGSVTGPTGAGIAGARVAISGPASANTTTDDAGAFFQENLPGGAYTAQVDAEGYLLRSVSFQVVENQEARVSIALTSKPKTAQVEISAREVRIRKKIRFNSGSAEISEQSNDLLSEIADVLLRNPQVKRVQIQGHTDNRGGSAKNKQLSQERAESVMRWLVNAGVSQDRLEAKGYGDVRPLVPNLTPGNRARNRRVQFIILEQE